MKKTSNKLLFLVASVFTFILMVSTLASEKPVSFSDVPINSLYYDAVVYFAGKGIVSEQKDRLFHPEVEISSKEWADILSSMNAESAQFTANTAAVDPADCYASIWKIAKIETYPASDYGYVSDLDAGTTAMIISGLIQQDDVSRETISRGEALRLLYEIVISKSVTEVPASLASFFEVQTGEGCSPDSAAIIRTLLAKYPNNQLALLLAYRYKFIVLTDLGLAPNGYSNQLGFEDVGEHIIYLKESAISEVLIHEVGHAVETCHNSYSKTWKLNKAEGVSGVKLLGEYAGTNANEYIAEATRYFIENSGNEAAMKTMQETIPQTYEYLAGVIYEKASLPETNFLSVVFAA